MQEQLKVKIKVHTDDLVAKGESEKQLKELESKMEEKLKETEVNDANYKEREKSLISECDVVSDKLTETEEKLYQLEGEMGKKVEEETFLKHELEEQKATIVDLNQKLTAASAMESRLNSQVAELITGNESAQGEITKLQEEMKALQQLVTGLESQDQ